MTTPSVTVTGLNQSQGPLPSVENFALFVGESNANNDTLQLIDQSTDLDAAIGTGDLRDNIEAAKLNAGPNWSCAAVSIAVAGDPMAAIDIAIDAGVVPEMAVVLPPMVDSDGVNALQAKAIELANQTLRLSIIGTISGIDAGAETWAQYITRVNGIVDGVSAYRVQIVPQLHGNNAGVLAGRLCSEHTSIADSPCRVKTGALVGLGSWPVDIDGVELNNATLKQLEFERASVPHRYPGYDGVYWNDGRTLDADGGDYTVIENLRVIDKVARQVYVLAVARIGDRQLNNSPVSEAGARTYFSRPLREMSKGTTFGGEFWPAEIHPPESDAITFTWPTSTQVQIWMKARPYNSPKTITANLLLDLSN